MLHLICYMSRALSGSYWDFAQEATDKPPGEWLADKIREEAGARRVVLVSATPITPDDLRAIRAAQKYEREAMAALVLAVHRRPTP